MAPTICSEKKPRQIRTNLKEIRRQPNTASALMSSATLVTAAAGSSGGSTSAVINGNGNAPVASSIINYVATGRNSSTLRVRSKLDTAAVEKAFLAPISMVRLRLEQNQQISDNVVSSSTTGPEAMRAITADEMDLDNDITDEEDCEVHSITSGAICHNTNNKDTTNSNSSDSGIAYSNNSHTRQLLQCAVKTVFPAPTLHDKHLLPITSTANKHSINSNNNNIGNSHNHHKRHYASDDDDEHDSDTYSSMCEIKNTEGLLAIALKTIKLVKRNQMLQRRLAQLQLETSEFIQSVLANPENRHFRDKMQSPATSPTPTTLHSPTTTTMRQQSQNATEA
ncbi:GATA zinc finger domain-containing protein 8 [Anastrepha ludens]|uniref:GATA zinc finger domain-containing protein 8 n=1 Tax=Anastrepha ludens TaxID=28586 RepID=UPI0023B08FA2|nr:GATA zinc finger domain-containing protein 8 [Anastrepha ludens]XP_053968204.1 GATA zinc finger domain-containing protein 8 [Anastrepha ludens]XP_053968209.1 GATA zinc finger domain-containing protein 8 [Anastrepha ludens]XP_053968217.1 GATA zinc finger domain-containing protein 8 [Anastrepha ludens]